MWGGGCKDRIFTQIVCAGSTVIAAATSQINFTRAYPKRKGENLLSARYTRLYSDPVSNFDIFHFATHLYHDSGTLMSQDNGTGEDEITNATSLPVMNVTSTNTSLLNVYSNVVLVT
jgi:hypothetical protein